MTLLMHCIRDSVIILIWIEDLASINFLCLRNNSGIVDVE